MEIRINDYVTVMMCCDDKEKADKILNALKAHVDKHGYCSVDMLFYLFNDCKMDDDSVVGWHNLEKASVHEYKDEKNTRVYLHMPNVEEIKWKEIVKDYD